MTLVQYRTKLKQLQCLYWTYETLQIWSKNLKEEDSTYNARYFPSKLTERTEIGFFNNLLNPSLFHVAISHTTVNTSPPPFHAKQSNKSNELATIATKLLFYMVVTINPIKGTEFLKQPYRFHKFCDGHHTVIDMKSIKYPNRELKQMFINILHSIVLYLISTGWGTNEYV